MNLFDEPEIHDAINYFNSLTDDEKAKIVSHLNPDQIARQHYQKLIPLLLKIRSYMSKYTHMIIGNKLVEDQRIL